MWEIPRGEYSIPALKEPKSNYNSVFSIKICYEFYSLAVAQVVSLYATVWEEDKGEGLGEAEKVFLCIK